MTMSVVDGRSLKRCERSVVFPEPLGPTSIIGWPDSIHGFTVWIVLCTSVVATSGSDVESIGGSVGGAGQVSLLDQFLLY